MSTRSLINEITHCPYVQFCLENPDAENPCRQIVDSQGSPNLEKHQIPEPWSGHIEQASILFLSSNPSISSDEDYPNLAWSDVEMNDYFSYRFGGGRKDWIADGTKSLLKDGTYSPPVRFWIEIRQRAKELFERAVIPGSDYALTEIVHCKSRSEIGVNQAQKQCVETYLIRVLELAKAKIIVVLGVRARQAVQSKFNIPKGILVSEAIKIGSYEKYFAFLPHPNARSHRSFAKCLQDNELERLRAFLR